MAKRATTKAKSSKRETSKAPFEAGVATSAPPAPQGAEAAEKSGKPVGVKKGGRFRREATTAYTAGAGKNRHLVIVESPSKAKTINKYLGRDYLVLASVGHVRDVYEAPQGLLLEVETATGRPLVPWHPGIIAHVDEAARVIVVKPLEGLLE